MPFERKHHHPYDSLRWLQEKDDNASKQFDVGISSSMCDLLVISAFSLRIAK